MRKGIVLVLLVLLCFTSVVTAQEETCTLVNEDGVVHPVGDLASCTEDALAEIYNHLQDQLGALPDAQIAAPATVPTPIGEPMVSGVWTVTLYPGVTEEMLVWLQELSNYAPDVTLGGTLFNEDWNGYSKRNLGEFPEVQESAYCEGGDACKFITPPLHFRYTAGDGTIPAIGESCFQEDGIGCVRIVFNYGLVNTELDANLKSNYSFAGRYFNGGPLVDGEGNTISEPDGGPAMPIFWWALSSYAANVMTNAESELNAGGITNAGGNCSSVDGCTGVRIAFDGMSGNQLLWKAETTFLANQSG